MAELSDSCGSNLSQAVEKSLEQQIKLIFMIAYLS